MSVQNHKDLGSKLFGRVHNIGAGGVDFKGESGLTKQRSYKRFLQRYNRRHRIFRDSPAFKDNI